MAKEMSGNLKELAELQWDPKPVVRHCPSVMLCECGAGCVLIGY